MSCSKTKIVAAPLSVISAVDDFEVEDGYSRYSFKPNTTTSTAWSYGVILKENNTELYWFRCLASASCRNEKKAISLGNGKFSTSNVKKHFKGAHGQFTEAYQSQKNKKMKKIDKYRASQLFDKDPVLCRQYLWTLLIIMNHLPFALVESLEARALFVCDENMDSTFHHKLLKRRITEIYAFIKMVICKKVENAFKFVHVPFINVVIDGWKSKTSGDEMALRATV